MLAMRALLSLGLAVTGPALARESSDRLPVRVYADRDGLPQNTIHAITLDRDGLLWVGTQDGAAVWDGVAWEAVAMPDRANANFVRTILAASDGSRWFGTQGGGLYRERNGLWEHHGAAPGQLASSRINALAEAEGYLVAATHDGGVSAYDGEQWRSWSVNEGLASPRIWGLAGGLHEGRSGVWVAGEGGLAFLELPGGIVVREAGFPRGRPNSVAVRSGSNGGEEVWVGTYGEGVYRLSGGSWSHLTAADGLGSEFVTSLATESVPPYRVWIGTDGGGVSSWREDRLEPFVDAGRGLPNDAVYSLLSTTAEQGARALWVGTRNGGLARVRELGWRAVSPVPETVAMAVTALAVETTSDGGPAIWFGTDGAGLVRRHGNIERRIEGLPSPFVHALLVVGEGPERQVWVGTRNGGLARIGISERVEELVTSADGSLPSDLVQALLFRRGARGEELWVGTREGLAIRRAGVWERFAGLDGASITALLESSDGTVWAGTGAGIVRIRDDRSVVLDRRDGLRSAAVLCLLETPGPDGGRLIWAGTDGGGIAIFNAADPPQLVATFHERSDPALPNDVVSALAQAPDGGVYALSNRGVADLALSDPSLRFGPSVHVHVYGSDDGLPALAGNRGAAVVDERGRLWVGTVSGAAYLDTAAGREEDRQAKTLVVRRIGVGGSVRAVDDPIVVRPGENILRVDFSLLSFFREQDSRYRSQLVGLETAPTAWSSDRSRELTGLPVGHYLLTLQGRDFEGNVSPALELPIEVEGNSPLVLPVAVALLALALLVTAGMMGPRLRRERHQRAEALELASAARRDADALRAVLVGCGLAQSGSGLPNEIALRHLLETPRADGGALVLLAAHPSEAATDAVSFELRAGEVLSSATEPGTRATIGRLDEGVVWAWLPGGDHSTASTLADRASAALREQRSDPLPLVAIAVGEPGHLRDLPALAEDALRARQRDAAFRDAKHS